MITVVWAKELKEALRDKKTLWFVVLMPTLLMPLLMGGTVFLMSKVVGEKHQAPLRYALFAPETVRTSVFEMLVDESAFDRKQLTISWDETKIKALVQNGELDFILRIPNDFHAEAPVTSEWVLYFNQAADLGQFNRIEQALQPLLEQWRDEHRQRLSLSTAEAELVSEPITINRVGTAPKREDVGERIGGGLPYLLLTFSLLGAMLPALDLGSGEKERGTLSTLLVTPAPLSAIVAGKFLAIMSCSVLLVLLTLVSGLVWALGLGQFMAVDALLSAINAVGLLDILLVLLLILPVCGVFSALLLAVSIYARTYKEGQNYMSWTNIVLLLAAMMAWLPGVKLTWPLVWVPLANVTLATKELVKGTVEYGMLLPVFGVNAVFTLLLLGFCCFWFSREQVLFR